MAKPKIYMDTCCFVELVISEHGKFEHADDELVRFYKLLIRASQADKINLYTSMLTMSESLCINDGKKRFLDDEVKRLYDSILLSDASGIIPVQPTEFIIVNARNMNWDGIGINKPMDLLHLASAIQVGCQEFVTKDREDFNQSVKEKVLETYQMKIINNFDECEGLPENYKEHFRQGTLDFPEEEEATGTD